MTKFSRTPVMRHFVFWHVINAHGRAPGCSTTVTRAREIALNINLAHFVEPTRLYLADSEWGDEQNSRRCPGCASTASTTTSCSSRAASAWNRI